MVLVNGGGGGGREGVGGGSVDLVIVNELFVHQSSRYVDLF